MFDYEGECFCPLLAPCLTAFRSDGEMTMTHCLTVIITFWFLRLIVLYSCFLFLVLWLQLPQCSTVVCLFQSDVNNVIKCEFKSQICPYPMRAELDYWIGITKKKHSSYIQLFVAIMQHSIICIIRLHLTLMNFLWS